MPGLGRVPLHNLWAVVGGQSSDAIVVMAHRDDTGVGPGANDNASGTAALVELARGYAQADTPASERVRPAHTIVFLSTDGGAFGALGAVRFAKQLALPDRRGGQPAGDRRPGTATDRDRGRHAALAGRHARRDRSEAGARADRLPGGPRGLRRPAPRPRVPVHALRARPLRRPRHPGGHPDDGRRAAARRVHGPAFLADGGASGRDGPGGAGPRRLARPGLGARAGDDYLHLGGRPDHPRLGGRSCS